LQTLNAAEAQTITLGEMRDSARKMREHGQRVKEITAKLLCLCHKAEAPTRAAIGAGGSGEAALDLRALLEALVAERRARMAAAGVQLTQDIARELPLLTLPAAGLAGTNLSTALGNILDNALDAMPQGGNLRIGVGVQDREAHIEIADTGCGILPAHLPRVFEPFFSTKDVGQGTGLGLSVSYGTVKALGGDIDIASQPGAGARVLITLPC